MHTMEEYIETKGNQHSPTAVLLNLTLVVVAMVASSAVLVGGIYLVREGYKFLLFEFCGTHGDFGSKYGFFFDRSVLDGTTE